MGVVDYRHRVGPNAVRSEPREDLERRWLQTTPVHRTVARDGELDGVHRHSVEIFVLVTAEFARAGRNVVDV